MKHHGRSFWLAGVYLAASGLFAQSEYRETSELSSYVGAGIGARTTNVWVGGSTGISNSKYFMATIDTSFLPLGTRTLRTNLVGATNTSRLYDFNFQGQILIPIHYRITPYALLGAGVLWNTYNIAAVHPDGGAYVIGSSDCKFGFQTGGGVRIFAREGFGFRTEYRFTASSQNFNRMLFGVFYQFAGTWPFLSRNKQRRGAAGLR